MGEPSQCIIGERLGFSFLSKYHTLCMTGIFRDSWLFISQVQRSRNALATASLQEMMADKLSAPFQMILATRQHIRNLQGNIPI